MRYYKISLISALLLGIAVIVLAQFSIPTLFDADGYYHIRLSEFIKQYGLRYDFHWARYSVFAKNFADKDLLYHLLTIPFTFLPNIFFGAKLAACLFAVFFYLVFFLVLKRYCLPALVAVFLVSLFSSPSFLHSLCRMRPMVFIIGLTLLYVHFLITKKQWGLFIVTFIYTLSHVSSPLLLLFAFLTETVRFINERQFAWRSILSVSLGLAAGFLAHPNFPNNLLIFYLNGILVPMYALKWGLELGAEFFPADTREFILGYPVIFLGLIFLLAQATSPGNRIKIATKIWLCIAGFFFVLSFFSRRYIIHSYPVILIAFASYICDWWQSQERYAAMRQNKVLKIALAAAALLIFLLLGFNSYKRFHSTAISEMVYNRHYEIVGNWMKENIPAGETIFHANWSDSQYFIGLNPKNDYFVTMDPIFMYWWNPQKYKLYRDIAFGRTSDPYTLLKKEFDVRYGYAGKDYFSGLVNQIIADTRFEVLAQNNFGLVFRLK